METSARLFSNKNSDYGDAYVVASDIMQLLIPDKSRIVTRTQQVVYHNFYVIVCKLVRASNLLFRTDVQKINDESVADTMRDGGVYFNMLAEIVDDRENNDKEFGE